MNNIGIHGIITVETVDKETGKIKQSETVHNTITDAYKKYALYALMNAAPMAALDRVATGASYSTSAPAPTIAATVGLYAMNKEINIHAKTFIPPYFKQRVSVTPATYDNGLQDVVFYNIAGATAETNMEMTPVDSNCYINYLTNEIQMQYQKNSGSGIIKSVVIGKTHRTITGTAASYYTSFIKDRLINSTEVFDTTNTINYVQEPTSNGTIIHKQRDVVANGVIQLNTKTRETVNTPAVAAYYNNILTHAGGIVAKNALFKAYDTGVISGKTITWILSYIPNWKAATTVKTLSIVYTVRDDISVPVPLAANIMPILVLKDANTIELFAAVSVGNHAVEEGDPENGANVWKAVIDISDIQSNDLTLDDVSLVDLGILPYVPGYLNVAKAANLATVHVTGQFINNKYYLPISGIPNGGITNVAASIWNSVIAAYQEGVIVNPSTMEIEDYYCVRSILNTHLVPVDGVGGFQQIVPNLAGALHYAVASQVVSGANLQSPITKETSDILRITYKYSME